MNVPQDAQPELDSRVFDAQKYRFMALVDLWASGSRYCTLARFGKRSTYTREQLKAMSGEAPFDWWLEGALASKELASEAWINGAWRRISLETTGLGGGGPPNLDRIAAQLRAARTQTAGQEPGLGEVAHHLRKHEGLGRDEAKQVAKGGGCTFDESVWLNAEKYGARRAKKGDVCRVCEPRAP